MVQDVQLELDGEGMIKSPNRAEKWFEKQKQSVACNLFLFSCFAILSMNDLENGAAISQGDWCWSKKTTTKENKKVK